MAKKTIFIKKSTVIFSIILIAIAVFTYVKYDMLSSELLRTSNYNEELIEKEKELRDEVEDIENEKREEENQKKIKTERNEAKARQLANFMVDNLESTYNIRIDLSKRLMYLDNYIMHLDRIHAYYEYMDSRPQYGYDYIAFMCLDGTSCMNNDGNAVIGVTIPVTGEFVAEKIVRDLRNL